MYMQEHSNYDKIFADEFKKFLSGKAKAALPSADNKENVDYKCYIEDHLKKKECPSFCTQLWYVPLYYVCGLLFIFVIKGSSVLIILYVTYTSLQMKAFCYTL